MKLLFSLICILAIIIGGYTLITKPSATINGKKISLLIANTDELRVNGLSGKGTLPNSTGMLFLFPDKQERMFWNKEMQFPIDLYWLDGNKIVGVAFLPPVDRGEVTVTSPSNVSQVLEVPQGMINAAVGDTIEFNHVPKEIL